jgi:hypothetical protein
MPKNINKQSTIKIKKEKNKKINKTISKKNKNKSTSSNLIKKKYKKKENKKQKTLNQKGGANIATAAIDTVKSMIGLGVNIGKEIDAIMHMGSDFNKATNVKLPNQTTPDQSVTGTTSSYKNPTFPKAKV